MIAEPEKRGAEYWAARDPERVAEWQQRCALWSQNRLAHALEQEELRRNAVDAEKWRNFVAALPRIATVGFAVAIGVVAWALTK